MNRKVALCIDGQSLRDPSLIGLEGEALEAQDWLSVYSEGALARDSIGAAGEMDRVWVASADDVEPINLAAALKADRADLQVSLVAGERCGSLCSRARTARIDEVLDQSAFVRRYVEEKQRARDALGERPAAAALCGSAEDAPAGGPLHAREGGGGAGQAPGASMALDRPRSRRGFLMSVVSGSGGAGKSSVAVMAALSAARRGLRVLLLDYDLQFGDMAVMAGTEDILEVDTALAQPDRLQRFMERRVPVAVLSCPARLEAAETVVQGLPALLDRLAAAYDVIIANTGAAWADQHALLLERSSIALFLIDQRSSSLRACRHALELCGRCGIASVPFRFALNHCSKNAPFTAVEVSSMLQGVEVFELREGGIEVEECLSGGAAAELASSSNDFAVSVDCMMGVLLPGAEDDSLEVAPRESGGIFRRRGRHGGKKRGR